MSAANMVGMAVSIGKDGFPQFPPVLLPEHNEKVTALKARWAQNKRVLNNTNKTAQERCRVESTKATLKQRHIEALAEKDTVLREAQQLAFQIADAGTSASSDNKELAVTENNSGVLYDPETVRRMMHCIAQETAQRTLQLHQGQQLALQDQGQDQTREQLREDLEDEVRQQLREDFRANMEHEAREDWENDRAQLREEFEDEVRQQVEEDFAEEAKNELKEDDDFRGEAKNELKDDDDFREEAKNELKEDDNFRAKIKKELKEDDDFCDELKNEILEDNKEYIEEEVTKRVEEQVAQRLEEAKRVAGEQAVKNTRQKWLAFRRQQSCLMRETFWAREKSEHSCDYQITMKINDH